MMNIKATQQKKHRKLFLTSLLGAFLCAGTVMAQDPVSLRGNKALDQNSSAPVAKHYLKDGEPIKRDYVQQPPLIPHRVDRYRVNRKSNKCLSCHSWKNYREAGATKISQTHFEDREKHVLANVSARRYFCTQCHVPQVNAQPLVENHFEPLRSLDSQR